MKEYLKPSIIEEELELEDVIAVSSGTQGDVDVNGQQGDVSDLWPKP